MVIMAPLARRYPRALGSLSRTQVLFIFIKPYNPISRSNVLYNQREMGFVNQFARDYSTFAAAACGIDSIMRVTRGKDDLTNQ